MGTFLQILGKVWIIAIVIVVLVIYADNLASLLATLLAFLPGIVFLYLGNRIKTRRARTSQAPPPAPE